MSQIMKRSWKTNYNWHWQVMFGVIPTFSYFQL